MNVFFPSLVQEFQRTRQVIVGIIVLISFILSSFAAQASNDAQKFLILESFPWAFYDQERLKGVAVDWLSALSAQHNLAITPVVASFQRGFEYAKRGDIDFMIAPDTPRFRAMGTPVLPVLSVPLMLVARPGLSVTDTAKLMDFSSLGLVSGLLLDEVDMPAIALPPVEEVHIDSALRRMAVGRLDALIVSKFALMAEAARQDLPIQRWPQRGFGTLQLALFIGPNAAGNPQTAAVVRAVREARDARSYLAYMARYLNP